MAGLDQLAQVLLGAEARVQAGEVVGPVAVVRPIGKPRPVHMAGDVLHQGVHPDGSDAEGSNLVQLRKKAFEIAPMEGAFRLPVDVGVVSRVAVGEPIDQDEVEDVV